MPPEMRHDLTVGIIARNASTTIGNAIQSALLQTVEPREIIVVDDDSKDDTAQLARSVGGPRVRIISLKTQVGIPAARNLVVDACETEFLAWLDADDTCLPNRFQVQLSALTDPSLMAVGCWAETYSLLTRKGAVSDWLPLHSRTWAIGALTSPGLLFGNSMPMSGALVRRGHTGFSWKFNETFPVAEDYEYWLRLSRYGNLKVLPRTLVRRWESRLGASDTNHENLIALSIAALRDHLESFNLKLADIQPLLELVRVRLTGAGSVPPRRLLNGSLKAVCDSNEVLRTYCPSALRAALTIGVSAVPSGTYAERFSRYRSANRAVGISRHSLQITARTLASFTQGSIADFARPGVKTT